jgi:carbon-monoxide dehydrogenase medium subunit
VRKLPPFELHRPASCEEATALLERYGDDAAVYSGGTELLLLVKLGFADFGHLIDVKGIPELQEFEATDGRLEIGGAVTHRAIECSPVVRGLWPALAEMERSVANIRVRTSGSLGGNLCFSDPHSDPATFLLAAEAEVVLRRAADERTLALRDFVIGPYETALGPGELLARVLVPALPARSALVHKKLAFHERPAATVSCLARVEEGEVTEARVAVGSVGVIPVRVPAAESALLGLPNEAAVEAAGEAAAEASAPVDDTNGSVRYKRQLVKVLVKRAFAEAQALALVS